MYKKLKWVKAGKFATFYNLLSSNYYSIIPSGHLVHATFSIPDLFELSEYCQMPLNENRYV